jgi:hypothetical protein
MAMERMYARTHTMQTYCTKTPSSIRRKLFAGNPEFFPDHAKRQYNDDSRIGSIKDVAVGHTWASRWVIWVRYRALNLFIYNAENMWQKPRSIQTYMQEYQVVKLRVPSLSFCQVVMKTMLMKER